MAQKVVASKYKASAKKYLAMQGMGIGTACRDLEVAFREDDVLTLHHLSELVADSREALGIASPVF